MTATMSPAMTAMPAPPPRRRAKGITPIMTHPSITASPPIDMALNPILVPHHPPSTANIIDVLSAAAQQGFGSKALNFRRLHGHDVNHFPKYVSTAMASTPPSDEWEFVDFERVFSKTPGLGGVLENCEIQFRSAPHSPLALQQLNDVAIDGDKINDHPFEFQSKEASRHNTAPGTPLPDALRVPSISKVPRTQDTTSASPNNTTVQLITRTISGRDLDLSNAPQARARNTSTSSTISELDDEDKKIAKLEKNRTSARECRRRKKEYISSLEAREKQLQRTVETQTGLLKEHAGIIGELVAQMMKADPKWSPSATVRAYMDSNQMSHKTQPRPAKEAAAMDANVPLNAKRKKPQESAPAKRSKL